MGCYMFNLLIFHLDERQLRIERHVDRPIRFIDKVIEKKGAASHGGEERRMLFSLLSGCDDGDDSVCI